MALDLNVAMDAIGTRLRTIAGMRVYDYPPDSVPVPACVISYPEALIYDVAFAAGADMATFPVHVLVGKGSDRASRDAIADYSTRGAAASVKTALEADPTLAGAVDSLRVQQAVFHVFPVGGVEYIAATFDVEVYA